MTNHWVLRYPIIRHPNEDNQKAKLPAKFTNTIGCSVHAHGTCNMAYLPQGGRSLTVGSED